MTRVCSLDGCAVVETGRCALEKDPNTCPNRALGGEESDVPDAPVEDLVETSDIGEGGEIGGPVLAPPTEVPSFPKSTTLSPTVIESMMSRRYVTIVGILGDPESGKTACLASLYLLISHAQLQGWNYADSRSLRGFEEIARGARRWNEGEPPEQMTVHTQLDDDRQAGFLHVRLRREKDGRRLDLAFPDLPGEWTKALIRSSNSDRLEFLNSADVIWIVVDGSSLNDREKRQGTITRLGQLAGRLCVLIQDTMPRLVLVVTRRDTVEISSEVLGRIERELAKYDLIAEMVPVAPFSDNAAVEPGFGLTSLVHATLGKARSRPPLWPSTAPKAGSRSFLSFRRTQ